MIGKYTWTDGSSLTTRPAPDPAPDPPSVSSPLPPPLDDEEEEEEVAWSDHTPEPLARPLSLCPDDDDDLL